MSNFLKDFAKKINKINNCEEGKNEKKEKKFISFKERLQKEQDKFLLRKKKKNITKTMKKIRRKEGFIASNKNKGLKKIEEKKNDLLQKNIKYLESSKENFKIKSTILDKIYKKI